MFFWLVKRQIISEQEEKALTVEGIQKLTIPMPLPYMQSSSFESVGEYFEHNGEFLRVVNLHWENDSLHLTYFKDHGLKKINENLKEYRSIFDDQESSSPFKIPPGFLKEYQACNEAMLETANGWVMQISLCIFQCFMTAADGIVETPPPKLG